MIKWSRALLLGCGLLAGAGAGHAAEPDAGTAALAFEKYTLDNGLEVLLHVDHQVPLVTVNVWYHVGSFQEPRGKSGLAHLCEHLMFRGSKHVQASHQGILNEVGALDHNGSTTFHQTSYFETVPRVNLQTALWLESDRMGFLADALDESKLRNEREVVKNERRQLFETAPYGLAEEKLWHALFPWPHPYHGLIIGSMAELDAVTLADVQAFFRKWYAPSNATLALVGDFDGEQARRHIRRYFGTLPRRPRPPLLEVEPAALEREIVIHHREKVGTTAKVVLAWHSPAQRQPGDAAGEVLAAVLSGSRAGRLYRRLGGGRGLASAVSASQDSLRAQSVFKISAVLRPGVGPPRAVQEIDAVLDEVRRDGPSEEEIGRARLRLRTRSVAELQESAAQLRRLEAGDRLGGPEAPPERLIFDDSARHLQVSREDVVRFAREVLVRDRRVVLFAVPPVESLPPVGGR